MGNHYQPKTDSLRFQKSAATGSGRSTDGGRRTELRGSRHSPDKRQRGVSRLGAPWLGVLLSLLCAAATACNVYALVARVQATTQCTGVQCNGEPSERDLRHLTDGRLHTSGCRRIMDAAAVLRLAEQSAKDSVAGAMAAEASRAGLSSSRMGSELPANQSGLWAHVWKTYQDDAAGKRELDRWSHNDGRVSHVVGKISHEKGKLIALESGYYYVYSQVGFLMESIDMAYGREVAIHELMRMRGGYMETIAKARNRRCWFRPGPASKDDRRFSMTSSFIGLVIYMQLGDQLFVRVDDFKFVVQGRAKTFFGAFLVAR